MKILLRFTIIGLLFTGLFSCEKDDDNNDITSSGEILIATRIPNPDGMSGSAYTQLISNLEASSYDNSTALPTSYSVPPIVIGEDVYDLPGFSGETDVLKKYSRIDGKLVEQGTFTLPENSGANALVTKGNTAYISLCFLGRILVIDHTTMTKIADVDISSYGVGDENPDPAIMVLRDDLLFIGLNQIVGGFYPNPNRACADILVFDTKTNQPVKMITDSISGFSMPTKPEADEKSIFIDENNDIYVNCISGFGSIGHKSGLLRIKSGETEFDNTYSFCVSETTIKGEANKASYLVGIQYAGNGKLYASANINEYYSNPPNYLEDRSIVALELDLIQKTINLIDIPRSNNFGAGVGLYNNSAVVFGFSTTTQNGFFTYNPITNEVSAEAPITVEGFPATFRQFNSKY